jgi:hypothetical protein
VLAARDTLVAQAIVVDAAAGRPGPMAMAPVVPLGRSSRLRRLSDVQLRFDASMADAPWGALRGAAAGLFDSAGPRIGYAETILANEPDRWMFDGRHYRLVRLDEAGDRLGLTFGRGSYFETLDSCEALAHEMAARPGSLQLRDVIGHPGALAARSAGLSACAVTFVVRDDGPRVYLVQRSATVAVAPGLAHVVPAGEFQPWADRPWDDPSTFRIEFMLERELKEELGGLSETEDAPSFLDALIDAGYADAFCWGVFADALSWKPELICALVFDAAAFDDALGPLVTMSAEGSLIGGIEGVSLSDLPAWLAPDSGLVPTARAAVWLALRDRDRLLSGR